MSQKILKNSICVFHPNLFQNSHWKCKKNSKKKKKNRKILFTQMYLEIATGNVTKIKRKFKMIITEGDRLKRKVVRNSH